MRRAIVFLLCLLAIAWGSARAEKTCPAKMTSTTPFVNLPCMDDDPRWAEAYSHWDKRADNEHVNKAAALFEAIAADNPDSLETWLWVTRARYLKGMRAGREKRKTIMLSAIEAADRALEIKPGNEYARFWRYASILHVRDFTDKEFSEIRAFGRKYDHLREFPVPDDDPMWRQAISHWDKRLDRYQALLAIDLFNKLERKYPGRIEPKFWLCRSNYWMHYIEPTEEGKARWLEIAAEWGKATALLEPRNPGANYFTAASLGQYGTHTGFINMVRYSLDIARRLTIVIEEDPNYFYGGFSQYFALAIARAGSLVTRTAELVGFSQELIERSTIYAAHYEPRYIRNYYALGEMYLRLGREEEAKEYLRKTLKADPAALKLQEPENRVAKEITRKLWKESFPDQPVPKG